MVGDEIAEEMTRVGFRCIGNLTTKALKSIFKLLIVKLGGGGVKKLAKGIASLKHQVSVKSLSKDGDNINSQEVAKSEIAGFDKYAKRYNLKYSLVREQNDPEHYFLSFRSKDTDKLQMCMTDFTKSKDYDKSSTLDEKLKNAQEKAHTINEVRNKERGKSMSKGKTPKKVKGVRER